MVAEPLQGAGGVVPSWEHGAPAARQEGRLEELSITPSLAEELRRIPAFADLAPGELSWFGESSHLVQLRPGDLVTREGEPADRMLVLLEGELHVARETGPPDGRLYILRGGQISGMLPFSRMTHFAYSTRAVVPSRLVWFPAALFPELLRRIPVLEARLVGVLTDRVREVTRHEELNEKLMALGKLSAGLAHELNNPAAAVRRSADDLQVRLVALRDRTIELIECGLSKAGICAAADLRAEVAARPRPELEPLAVSDRETEVAAWLEAHGVASGWRLAPTFVGAGFTVADLDTLPGRATPEVLPAVLLWLETGLGAQGLLGEIQAAARRISGLIDAVKAYSHMDDGLGREETDINGDLLSTLTMLAHKVGEKRVEVTTALAPDLPRIEAFAGELTQVWTSLIDNALDAVSPGGRVVVRTGRENAHVRVEIQDDGPGIPAEILDRIWEPFFTTKPVGSGTGLGLDIAHRIVVRRHGGDLWVESRPGDTRFFVRLPREAPRPPGPTPVLEAVAASEEAPRA